MTDYRQLRTKRNEVIHFRWLGFGSCAEEAYLTAEAPVPVENDLVECGCVVQDREHVNPYATQAAR